MALNLRWIRSSETQNPKSKSQSLKLKTQNPKLKIKKAICFLKFKKQMALNIC